MSPSNFDMLPVAAPVHFAATPRETKSTVPQPPKRLRSAFIMFSAEKHKQIRVKLSAQGISEKTTNVAKLVSQAWKSLDPEEKKIWEGKAQQDKVRYMAEKACFKGTWKVKRRKDPNAPKRPMSAYLAFSNSRRALATKEHPVATNSEISKILSKMWKDAPPEVKKEYVEKEAELRAQYKLAMAQWKKVEKETKRNSRKAAPSIVMKTPGHDEDASFTVDTYHMPGSPGSQAQTFMAPPVTSALPYTPTMTKNIMSADGLHLQSMHAFSQGQPYTQQQQQQQQSAQSQPTQDGQYRSPLTELLAGRDPANAHFQWINQVSPSPAPGGSFQNTNAQATSAQVAPENNAPPPAVSPLHAPQQQNMKMQYSPRPQKSTLVQYSPQPLKKTLMQYSPQPQKNTHLQYAPQQQSQQLQYTPRQQAQFAPQQQAQFAPQQQAQFAPQQQAQFAQQQAQFVPQQQAQYAPQQQSQQMQYSPQQASQVRYIPLQGQPAPSTAPRQYQL